MISLILPEIRAAHYNDAHFSRMFHKCVFHVKMYNTTAMEFNQPMLDKASKKIINLFFLK